MRNKIAAIAVAIVGLFAFASLIACEPNTPSNDLWTIDRVYAEAQELGFEGTLEELIALFKGEKGEQGSIGKDGVGIENISLNDKGEIVIILTNQTEINLGVVKAGKCEHAYGSYVQVLAPTCTSIGYEVAVCTKCDSKDYNFIAATGHKAKKIIEKNSDYHEFLCSECGEYIKQVHIVDDERSGCKICYSPIGVMFLIDCSGSMDIPMVGSNTTKLDIVKGAAKSCLDILTNRDYAGVMPLSSETSVSGEMSSITNRSKIESTIDALQAGGNTLFLPALERAGQMLGSFDAVDIKHIIIITDGEPVDSINDYGSIIRNYYKSGITLSIVNVGRFGREDLILATEYGGGNYYEVDLQNPAELIQRLMSDIYDNVDYNE